MQECKFHTSESERTPAYGVSWHVLLLFPRDSSISEPQSLNRSPWQLSDSNPSPWNLFRGAAGASCVSPFSFIFFFSSTKENLDGSIVIMQMRQRQVCSKGSCLLFIYCLLTVYPADSLESRCPPIPIGQRFVWCDVREVRGI